MATTVDIGTGLAISTPEAEDRTTPQGMRRALAGLLVQDSPGAPRAGVLSAAGSPLTVAGTGSMTYEVQPGVAVITREGEGAYIVASAAVVEVDAPTADGTHPRIDRIYICQPDPQLTDTGKAHIGVVSGVPGAVPEIPDLPAGSLELARKVIAAGATNTTAGTAFTDAAQSTYANFDFADGSVTTVKLADGAVTNVKIDGMSASKLTGTIPSTVTSNANHTGKILDRNYYIQQAEPEGAPDGSIWDSW